MTDAANRTTIASLQADNAKLREAFNHIETLRSNFGSITILPDDDEATTRARQMAVDYVGEWTGWESRRFYGMDVSDCLSKAIAARAALEEQSKGQSDADA